MIKIGTSGYSFDDWIGTIYPENIKKPAMLNYYEEQLGFNVVELNYTYYTLPSQKAIAGMLNKVSPNFEFAVKAFKGMTHNVVNKDTGKLIANDDVFERFKYSITPLAKENRLACILAQFPYSFHYNQRNVSYLKKFKDLMGEIPLVFEFRNAYWHNNDILEELKKLNVAYCIVDEPKLKGLMPFHPIATSDIGYFRFHGRNQNWFDAPTSVRYDYLYSKDEINTFIEPIKKINKRTNKTLVFFNNCHAGSAAKNAVQLAKAMDLEFHSTISP